MISINLKQDIKIKMATITSIYVPRMSSVHDEYCVMREFEEIQQIGKVSRVDFVPIGKQPGFTEPDGTFVRSAFIHFDYYYNNEKSIKIMEKLCRGDNHKIDVLITTSPSRYVVHTYEYWILLKAKNPVKKTMMNKHQIVDNCRFLEEKIEEQTKTLEKQAKKIKELQKKTHGMDQVVYQLIALSFDEVGQDFNVRMLAGEFYKEKDEDDEDDDATISTHSSMPKLVDITDNWSGSNKSVEDRIRISHELCGNE
jgi:hypothetical protein